ncbi:acetyl-CoA synthetase, partial [Candidatus Bathyarchaeota archaeon]|nr:acetyl-CoA synthetase [Candidatus Bathyarchaeota archaeon]NIV43908.1 acetyl-CoA synthetase [Candidatus Bathyarchaeota archaeon]
MKKVNAIFEAARSEGRKYLLEPEAKTICVQYGIPVTKFEVATNESEAVQFAKKIGFPIV